ncbi:hypothetical protein [Pseudoduganella violaceinigra]|uniref:hypothetical protein n=1 Tax=Pseudoduganella violaceinigra TaxID=246602 RepID=UPI0012B50525|nr:hypothetical protein [Pseudoduganella violaceinigra]
MTKIRKTVYAVSAILVAGCFSVFALMTLEAADYRRFLEERLANVDVSDGIDAREADQIAWAYFLGFVSGCGGPDAGQLVSDEWVIPASEGFAGRPMDAPIRINAKTGAVSQTGNMAFRDYRNFRLYLLWGIPFQEVKRYIDDYYLRHWASSDEMRG